MRIQKRGCLLLALLVSVLLIPRELYPTGAYHYHLSEGTGLIDPSAHTVIGAYRDYIIKREDTLLDIARNFDLGYLELILLHPAMDPWLPPAGEKIQVPTIWILPSCHKRGIVINIPELRLYFFLKEIQMVKTYPLGLGVLDWPTPYGSFMIREKVKDPTWHIPPTLQEKYGMKFIPPGPDNPLGSHWLRISDQGHGIHGTNAPWGVGRLVSHGCIRLYPEDIEELFNAVDVGTPVEIIYEPIKIGFKDDHIFVEVHPDIYNKIADPFLDTAKKLFSYHVWDDIDLNLLALALEEQKGIPVDITRKNEGAAIEKSPPFH